MHRDTIEEIVKETKYCLTESLGEGGFSCVYLVIDKHIGKEYALKVVEAKEEYKDSEIKLLKNLKHEGLPDLHDVFMHKDYTCIVMEYIKGESLEQYVAKKGKLLPKEAMNLGKQLSEILCYLHSRNVPVIHGDLKPQNIMIQEGRVRLIDFGSAFRQYDKKEHVYGTKGYASPEQYQNELFTQSDIYSFGMVMLYMLTGRQAYLFVDEITINELKRYGIPFRLRRIIMQCLSFEVNERFSGGKELKDALKKVKGMTRQLPGQCIAWISTLIRLFGMLSLLQGLFLWKQQYMQDIRCLFIGSVCVIILSYITESFSYKAYKTAILECECSLFVSEGL